MGANAQTTVPTFTAGEVLTAAQQNNSARTGVPVFATTGTRDAGFGGTGEKTLAEGQLCYVEGTGLQSYNGTSWVTWGTAPSSGALVRVGGGTLSASTTTITNVFSATYDSYLIIGSGLLTNTSADVIGCRMGSTATGYYFAGPGQTYNGTNADSNGANDTLWVVGYVTTADYGGFQMWLHNPFASQETVYSATHQRTTTTGAVVPYGGWLNNQTSYTDIAFINNGGNTFAAGKINVYGLALS